MWERSQLVVFSGAGGVDRVESVVLSSVLVELEVSGSLPGAALAAGFLRGGARRVDMGGVADVLVDAAALMSARGPSGALFDRLVLLCSVAAAEAALAAS